VRALRNRPWRAHLPDGPREVHHRASADVRAYDRPTAERQSRSAPTCGLWGPEVCWSRRGVQGAAGQGPGVGAIAPTSPNVPNCSAVAFHVMVPAIELRQNDETCQTAPISVKHGPRGPLSDDLSMQFPKLRPSVAIRAQTRAPSPNMSRSRPTTSAGADDYLGREPRIRGD